MHSWKVPATLSADRKNRLKHLWCDWLTSIFPRLATAASICFVFWLAHFIVSTLWQLHHIFSATPWPRSYAVDIYIAVQSLSHLNKHRNCIKRLLSGSLSSTTQYNDLTLPEKAFRFRSLCPVPWSFSFGFLPLANENEQIWSLFLPKLEILR